MKAEIILVLLLLPVAYAQEININADGVCHNFQVAVSAPELEGCWDVKLDTEGRVLNSDEWMSTFFYVENALCEGKAVLELEMSSSSNETVTVKLRQNNTILEKKFDIRQSCPILPHESALAVFAVIILILASGVWFYRRH